MDIKKETKIIYNQNSQFKFTNGAFGSINSGYLTVNFFFDRPKDAESFVIEIEDKTNNVKQFFNADDPIREVHTQIIMDSNTAKAIGEWLISKAKNLEELNNK